MSLKEHKAPASLPRCPVCNQRAVILETVNVEGVSMEWEVICDQEYHFIRVSRPTESEAMEVWKKAFTKTKPKTKEEIYKTLESFQAAYGFALHPKLGNTTMSLRSWSKLIAEIGRCPCDPERTSCPCAQAVDEVNVQGHCHCRMFWDDQCGEYKNWGIDYITDW